MIITGCTVYLILQTKRDVAKTTRVTKNLLTVTQILNCFVVVTYNYYYTSSILYCWTMTTQKEQNWFASPSVLLTLAQRLDDFNSKFFIFITLEEQLYRGCRVENRWKFSFFFGGGGDVFDTHLDHYHIPSVVINILLNNIL